MTIDHFLKDHPAWNYMKDIHAPALVRQVKDIDFAEVERIVRGVIVIAKETNHHPDVFFGYDYITVTTTTHDEGKVTAKDIKVAQKIDQLVTGK